MRRLALLTLVLGLMPATAHAAPRLGTPEVVTAFPGESNLIGVGAGAYVVFHRKIGENVYSVIHRDRAGRVHRFDLPTAESLPEAVRLVGLEDGGGMALWDARTEIRGRAWNADGTTGPVRTVLDGVATVNPGDYDVPAWQVRADHAGTVVVAATGDAPRPHANAVAAVRRPGGAGFGPAQDLPAAVSFDGDLIVDLAPVAADGSTSVEWRPESGPSGDVNRAVLQPGATTFDAPVAAQPAVSAPGALVDQDGRPVDPGPVAALCPCARARVFRWPGGTAVLAVQRYAGDDYGGVGAWYVARSRAGGPFGTPILATRNPYTQVVRRATPGEVGLARFDTNTDRSLFRYRSRLLVMPFGDHVPRSRRAPRVGLGVLSLAGPGRRLVPFWCDRVCTVRATTSTGRRVRVTDGDRRGTSARREPFDVAYVLADIRTRIVLRATDDAGRTTILRTAVGTKI